MLDNDLLIAKPVVLAATAGTARHALVADDAMRPMFAYLRTMTVPTSLFAAPEDWSDPALATRIDRAALELVLLMESGFARKIKDESWQNYQHEYGSAGRHRNRHRPRHRPHAPSHRRLRRITVAGRPANSIDGTSLLLQQHRWNIDVATPGSLESRTATVPSAVAPPG